MKKLFTAMAVILWLIFPVPSMAMSALEDSDLSTVTGQSGVSINFDANIHLELDQAAWGDKDGLGTTEASGAGWVGVSGIRADVRIRIYYVESK